jgi:hypothetical protein
MGILLIALVLAALGVLAYAAHRSLRRRGVSHGWRIAYFTALSAGVVAGIYFGFFFRYFASPSVEIVSFPVPAAFFVLEEYPDGESRWTDFITPAPILFAGSNVPIFACLAVLPVWLANTVAHGLQRHSIQTGVQQR